MYSSGIAFIKYPPAGGISQGRPTLQDKTQPARLMDKEHQHLFSSYKYIHD